MNAIAASDRSSSSTYRHYLLVLLLLILSSNYVDRLALGLLLQDIKSELHLSDTQLGLLTGIAFAAFYSLMGIPIARWADRGNRVVIISVTTLLWSAAVALCGFAATFVQLMLIRMGVAIGEAGCIPPAHSLIADHFSRAERPRAAATYMLGAPLSVFAGYFIAGWLNEIYGWRQTFMLLSLPGLCLAALAWFTLKEPRSNVAEEGASASRGPIPQPGIVETCVALWSNTTFRQLLFCFSVMSFFSVGMTQWKPAFFIRSFGLETGEVGTWFALAYGLGGLLGTYLGGAMASSRHAAHKEQLQLKVLAFIWCCVGVVSAALYLSSTAHAAFGLLALSTLGSAAVNGPLFAIIQSLIPQHRRATSVALLYLFANLIGIGLGPLAVGVCSDAFASWAGAESLRYALMALSPGYLWSAWYLWRASMTVMRDLESARAEVVRE